jgi:hypothetical protein
VQEKPLSFLVAERELVKVMLAAGRKKIPDHTCVEPKVYFSSSTSTKDFRQQHLFCWQRQNTKKNQKPFIGSSSFFCLFWISEKKRFFVQVFFCFLVFLSPKQKDLIAFNYSLFHVDHITKHVREISSF